MQTVVGIDLGTQSSKVIFYDFHTGTIVARQSAEHRLFSNADGTSEQEASDWVEAIRSCLARVSDEVRNSAVAMAVSGQQHGFVPLDSSGNPLYRVKLWNDTSTTAECRELSDAFGSEGLIREVGNPILPGYTASKILWFKKNKPELFAKLAHILLPHDYINFLLSGEYSMECGDASGTGLLNIRERSWNSELSACIDKGIEAMLPRLRGPEEGAGSVIDKAAKLFGIPEGIPIACGGGDNMMSAIGTGAVKPGIITMSLGTSGTVFAQSPRPIIDEKGIIAAFCSSTGEWLPLLCTMNCTVASEQARALFGVDLDELDEVASGSPPGAKGLTFLPFFTGERSPNLPSAKASIMGLDLTNTSTENIVRSAMESAIFGMRIGIESLQELGLKADAITLTGGGSQSRLWRQMSADICGLPVRILQSQDSAALGAALQALWFYQRKSAGSLSLQDIASEHVRVGEIVEPSREASAYASAYERYRVYLDSLSPLYEL